MSNFYLGGNYKKEGSTFYFDQIFNASERDLNDYLDCLIKSSDGVLTIKKIDEQGPNELIIYQEKEVFRMELMDDSNEWGCRVYFDKNDLNDEGKIEFKGHFYNKNLLIFNDEIMIKCARDFFIYGDISIDYFPE